MANHLDLEEQEQLDQLKAFWQKYGNWITWALIVILGAFATWNFYQRWQNNEAVQASALYDELTRVVVAKDVTRIDRVFGDMKEKYASTTFGHQGGLLAARAYVELGKPDQAKAALNWVAEKSSDSGYQAIAKLRLAAVLAEAKAHDEALASLKGDFPAEFAGLAADRRGDVLMAQGKKAEAKSEYQAAYQKMDERTEYRRLIEIKLNALGVDPAAEGKK